MQALGFSPAVGPAPIADGAGAELPKGHTHTAMAFPAPGAALDIIARRVTPARGAVGAVAHPPIGAVQGRVRRERGVGSAGRYETGEGREAASARVPVLR